MKTTSPEQDGEGDDAHTGQNPTAKHLSINLVACLLVSHLEICRPKPDLGKKYIYIYNDKRYLQSTFYTYVLSDSDS